MYGGNTYTQNNMQSQMQMPITSQAWQIPWPVNFGSAYALINAGPDYPSIKGIVTFTNVYGGVRVCADITGLPEYKPAAAGGSPIGPFGFHIHEKGHCEVGNPAKPFEGCGGHWNPDNQPHGNHAGDFPVLFSNDGYACMCFFSNRFTVRDILGRSVIIHENPDDYRTQPAGNSGKRIACGTIRPWNSCGQVQ